MGCRDEVTVIRKAHRVISHKTAGACALLLSKSSPPVAAAVAAVSSQFARFDGPRRCAIQSGPESPRSVARLAATARECIFPPPNSSVDSLQPPLFSLATVRFHRATLYGCHRA